MGPRVPTTKDMELQSIKRSFQRTWGRVAFWKDRGYLENGKEDSDRAENTPEDMWALYPRKGQDWSVL